MDNSTPPKASNLTVPFTSRSQNGQIEVTILPNHDAEHAHGLDLIFPHIRKSSFPAQFFNFPVARATIAHPIPATHYPSYASLFGWIQFVRAIGGSETGEWEMDIFPYAKDLGTPFAYWGHNPTCMDAPARLLNENGEVTPLVWRAQAFLCVLEDAGLSKKVSVLDGAGFGWGFDVEEVKRADGSDGVERKIKIADLQALDVSKEWRERLGLLRGLYPAWTFAD
jgi:hypothetical protein